MRNSILLFIVITFWSCTQNKIQPYSEKYVRQAFDSIQHYSLHKKTYNFDSLESVVLSKLTDSSSNENIHQQLEWAMKVIDRHSYIFTKEEFKQFKSGTSPETLDNPFPFKGKILEGKYAYLYMDGFRGGDSISSDHYTDSLQKLITLLYNHEPKGWVLDLRFNSGGWSYAMIAGIGPILGKGIKAYEIPIEGPETPIYYVKNDTDYIKLADSIYVLEKPLPVAILIGPSTASAAELITLAFQGNAKTTTIGQPTFGVSTSLEGFFMPDSLLYSVTNSIMTDRFKKGDGGPIKPEFFSENTLELFDLAYEWIDKNQD